MLIVEQTAVIEASMAVVMQALNDVENFPTWTTVEGIIDNVQGSGRGMTYEWHYSVEGLNFNGKSEVIEQAEDTLITKTTGDVDSLWTITLTAIGQKNTAIRAVEAWEILGDVELAQATANASYTANTTIDHRTLRRTVQLPECPSLAFMIHIPLIR